MANTLQWRPLGKGKVQDIPFSVDDENRVNFTLREGLEFGQLELNSVAVTGYFTPDDPDYIWVLRPYLLSPAPVAPAVALVDEVIVPQDEGE